MVNVKYKDKVFILNLTTDGFRLRPEKLDKFEYVKLEYVAKLCSLLNATYGYTPNSQTTPESGRLKINIPVEEREGLPLTKQRPVFWNTAVVINLLFPESTLLKNGFIVTTSHLKLEEIGERTKQLILKEEVVVQVESDFVATTEVKDENQQSIFDFVEGKSD